MSEPQRLTWTLEDLRQDALLAAMRPLLNWLRP
jgi:hypothetical protein